MIRISVKDEVLTKLKEAFPKPSAAANRALNKYISALESLIEKSLGFAQTPMQRKLDLYSISLHDLANKGGQIGPKKKRVHSWLAENDLSLVETVIPGSKFTKQNSQVKLTHLATLQDTFELQDKILSVSTADDEIELYLSGDPYSNKLLFEHLYPECKKRLSKERFHELFETVPVDIKSLRGYIYWLILESNQIRLDFKNLYLRHALTILAVANHRGGYYLQRKKPSPFGRMYYQGVSVQSVNKELRRAMLGNCWEYDIRSSVVSWKMGFARSYLDSLSTKLELRKVFRTTLSFLDSKAEFMTMVRRDVFRDELKYSKELQLKILKQAFTAISFGARAIDKGWSDGLGGWTNSAIVEIIQDKEVRDRFLNDEIVKEFIEEQGILDDFLYGVVKNQLPHLLDLKILQTPSGKASKPKVLAYLYQQDETKVMNFIREMAKENGREPIANVHDAIFFKHRLGVELKTEIEYWLRQYDGNPHWHLTPKEIFRYEPRYYEAEFAEQEHKERIRQEELEAHLYAESLSPDQRANHWCYVPSNPRVI